MSTEQMRSEFEKWFKREIIEKDDFEFNDFDEKQGEYIIAEDDDNVDLYLSIQGMYMAWQSSRAALVVELPSRCECCYSEVEKEIFDSVTEGCADAIRAAGITVRVSDDL